jgi:GrpB-like predicted nucleotidyltransferase (UPF0157 family)
MQDLIYVVQCYILYILHRRDYVHVMNKSSPKYKNKVIFRDYLKSHPEAVVDYENLKQNLASKHKYDRELYTQEKTLFIKEILDKENL